MPFAPGPRLYYLETRATATLPASECGLALQNASGALLVAVFGGGEVEVCYFVGGELVNQGAWVAGEGDASQTEVGLWIDGASVTVYLDDKEIETVEEPGIAGITQSESV
ncbi:MAG: hypothetical protein ABR609_10215 [Acidimicrobiia bacterium]